MAGDALGAPAEFLDRDEILAFYPHGLQSMVDGFGIVRDRLAGEVTDDSQMAACLQRALERADGYNPAIARDEYLKWLATDPPDVGETVQSTLMGIPKPESQGNGALMRVFPIALWTLEHPEFDWKSAAMDDAAITHTNFTCHLANLVFVSALHYALAVNYGQVNEHRVPVSPSNVLQSAITACEEFNPKPEAQAIIHVLREARIHPPEYDGESIGWVLVTLQGAFYREVLKRGEFRICRKDEYMLRILISCFLLLYHPPLDTFCYILSLSGLTSPPSGHISPLLLILATPHRSQL